MKGNCNWRLTETRNGRSYTVLHNADGTSGAGPFVISIAWRQSCQEHVQLPQTADIRRFWAVRVFLPDWRAKSLENFGNMHVCRSSDNLESRLPLSSLPQILVSLCTSGINKVPDTRESKTGELAPPETHTSGTCSVLRRYTGLSPHPNYSDGIVAHAEILRCIMRLVNIADSRNNCVRTFTCKLNFSHQNEILHK